MTQQSVYAFPLAIQLAMPDELREPRFLELLESLQNYRFHGIELNIVDFDRYPAAAYVELLNRYDLKLTMIASGAFAKRNGYSLSSPDAAVREKTLAALSTVLSFASKAGCGVICGFIKGTAGIDRAEAARNLRDSLEKLHPLVRELETPLLIEATNHYEASAAISLADTAELVRGVGNPYIRILPDTYHMNIEEADTVHALYAYQAHYQSVHISDNNRLFPGYGAIDFFKILAALKGMGYRGTMAIEGNWRGPADQDLAFTCAYLKNVSDRIALLQ